jgi:8-amino-7-oxononanoate synthase
MLIEHLSRQLRERDAASVRRRRRVVHSPAGPRLRLLGEGGERELLAFCSNDYLGLASHGRVDRLAALLEDCETPVKLIVTDGVFSMDGDIAPLPALLELAERHDAWIVIDDAHGLGVLGTRGRGTLSHFGLRSERVICMGTLGKAAGVAGAFVAAHPVIIDWLVQAARTSIYTTAQPPAVAHAALAGLRILHSDEGDERRARLGARIVQLRRGVATLIDGRPGCGWRLADSCTPIQPLIVGDNAAALALSQALERQGIWVPAIRPPTVPAGTARLRIALSAAHTPDDVQALLEALRHAMEELQ